MHGDAETRRRHANPGVPPGLGRRLRPTRPHARLTRRARPLLGPRPTRRPPRKGSSAVRTLIESTFVSLDGDISQKLMDWAPALLGRRALRLREPAPVREPTRSCSGARPTTASAGSWPQRQRRPVQRPHEQPAQARGVDHPDTAATTWNATRAAGRRRPRRSPSSSRQPGDDLLKFGSGAASPATLIEQRADRRVPPLAVPRDRRRQRRRALRRAAGHPPAAGRRDHLRLRHRRSRCTNRNPPDRTGLLARRSANVSVPGGGQLRTGHGCPAPTRPGLLEAARGRADVTTRSGAFSARSVLVG